MAKSKIEKSDINKRSTVDKIKEREKKYLLILAFVFIILIVIVFFSIFGFNGKNVFDKGELNVKYESDIMGLSDVIALNEDSVVDNNELGLATENYDFTISNKVKGRHGFIVYIKSDQAIIDLDGCNDKLANDDSIYFSINGGEAKSLSEVKTDDGYLILADEVVGAKTKEYKLNIWILRDKLLDINNNHFHGNIIIEEIEED